MNDLNSAFIEEFKNLEKLCNEIYNVRNGVSSYIDDMQSQPPRAALNVPGWQEDLKTLKRMRGIRNKLVHEAGTFNDDMCTEYDVEWLSEFRIRILNQEDPISLLCNRKDTPKPSPTPYAAPILPNNEIYNTTYNTLSPNTTNASGCLTALAVIALCVAIVATIVYIFI
ncbi:MAG: DUF6548 family protein [Eubacteriales bacterium]